MCLKIELRQSIWKGWRQSSPNGHVRCQSSYPYLRELRAECQSVDYDSKTERQITFATDSDNATTSERELAAKEEKRARESAYLAADVKSRIDKILESGRDQVGSDGFKLL